jgi:hypothetical protein
MIKMNVSIEDKERGKQLYEMSKIAQVSSDAAIEFGRFFALEARNMLEASSTLRADHLGLMVMSSGDLFTKKCERYMRTHGVSYGRIGRFMALASDMNFNNLYFKVEFGIAGVTEVSYYFRQRLPLASAKRWFANGKLSNENWSLIKNTAVALKQDSCLFGASIAGDLSGEKAYFFVPPRPESRRYLDNVISLFPNCHKAWDRIEDLKSEIENRMTALSLVVVNGKLAPYVKVDFLNVEPERLLSLQLNSSDLKKSGELIYRLMKIANQNRLEYAAVRLSDTHGLSPKAYIKLGLK